MSEIEGSDWVSRTADEVIAEADRRAPGAPVVCASGLSPSGPIHLGNLRELMVPHLVADEIRRRGRDCVHLLSWDDYDRLRRVPAGLPPSFTEHVGRPLTAVPDPDGAYDSWAERFKAPVRAAMDALGIEVREISQTAMYASGTYADAILRALDERARIDAILGRYRTRPGAGDAGDSRDTGDAGDVEQTGNTGDPGDTDAAAGLYYPYRPYCHRCGRDTTQVTSYDAAGAWVDYACAACGHRDRVHLREDNSGKLVWKVDWPMRWAHERVTFEPFGADHSAPGSSFTVGAQVVREVFGGEPPVPLPYSFVGIRGMAKMSSSAGGVPTPADGLRILEPAVLRWLYTRRLPGQAFTIDFGAEVGRLYDEWDRLATRIEAGQAQPWERDVADRSTTTSRGPVAGPRRRVSFRVLASLLDVTAGDTAQVGRILAGFDDGAQNDAAHNDGGQNDSAQGVTVDDVEPRLTLARTWLAEQVPAEERTHVRTEPDKDLLASLTAEDAASLRELTSRLTEDWTLTGLTRLVYGVPKLRAGLTLDDPATAEVKHAQRGFFRLLYRLLVGADRGPRLPTLLLALGPDRVRTLLEELDPTAPDTTAARSR
ncbi:lysyl-tRNA synthetase, class I [Actinopolymorpha cephalotaxi]|uniref:Lysine--tRNA ligase n=1 Tax=Actinopolymorpha cephalotaxi TaxID=504797 RepID=A0A1I2W2K3_9ACTN|nr:lysine--tRNA ligase [Actinopolymorpha cephalotaxi]NYH82835.1 lysyl-tRNA synthetase class 1 [Actinopolymorpha cephalotaxi]SFG94296.1 lysyl-tRNA synthetase, class I [Actinopolymorpha cephalotaxi]